MSVSLSKIIAHRGNSATEPENTMRAFLRAEELGAEYIECDVQVCASNELVVMHDEDVSRTTNGIGLVCSLTRVELQRLQCLYQNGAMSDATVPTLHDVYDQLKPETHIVVEMKGRGTGVVLADFLKSRIVKDSGVGKRTLVSSFNKHELRIFHDLMPSIRCAVTVWGTPSDEEITLYASWGMHALHINHEYGDTTVHCIQKAHEARLEVHVYTVDNLKLGAQLLDDGVDMLFTDDIGIFTGKHSH